ncbi:MAG: SAM-dependent methyltransferase [Dysosmobacter welbionis]
MSIYAACSYLAELLRGQGCETVMIAGVPSFCASAARLGVSLTEMNQGLHVLPGSADTEAALALPGTKVLMKSSGSRRSCTALRAAAFWQKYAGGERSAGRGGVPGPLPGKAAEHTGYLPQL